MNIIEKSIKATLFLVTLFTSSLVLAQEETVSAVQSVPIHAQLGLSSTMLFTIMTIFTLLLLAVAVSYTHLRAHETDSYLVCRLLLEKTRVVTWVVVLFEGCAREVIGRLF